MLYDLIWDQLPQRRALTNLRVTLTALQKTLNLFLAFKPEPDAWPDRHAFERLLIPSPANECRVLITPGLALSCFQAVDLYHSEFLQRSFLKDLPALKAGPPAGTKPCADWLATAS